MGGRNLRLRKTALLMKSIVICFLHNQVVKSSSKQIGEALRRKGKKRNVYIQGFCKYEEDRTLEMRMPRELDIIKNRSSRRKMGRPVLDLFGSG